MWALKDPRLVTEGIGPGHDHLPVPILVIELMHSRRHPQQHVPKQSCVLKHFGYTWRAKLDVKSPV